MAYGRSVAGAIGDAANRIGAISLTNTGAVVINGDVSADSTIAQILDCSETTVRTHAMRALNTLRRFHSDAAGAQA